MANKDLRHTFAKGLSGLHLVTERHAGDIQSMEKRLNEMDRELTELRNENTLLRERVPDHVRERLVKLESQAKQSKDITGKFHTMAVEGAEQKGFLKARTESEKRSLTVWLAFLAIAVSIGSAVLPLLMK